MTHLHQYTLFNSDVRPQSLQTTSALPLSLRLEGKKEQDPAQPSPTRRYLRAHRLQRAALGFDSELSKRSAFPERGWRDGGTDGTATTPAVVPSDGGKRPPGPVLRQRSRPQAALGRASQTVDPAESGAHPGGTLFREHTMREGDKYTGHEVN